jgi:hypothetical protein
MQIKVLIALYSFRGKSTNLVYPKRATLSKRCGYSERTISRITTELEKAGWLVKEGSGGRSAPSHYTLTVPDLETVSEVETVSDSDIKTVPEPSTKTVSEPDRGKEHTNEHTNEQKEPSKLITFKKYVEQCKANGKQPIPPDDKIFEYAQEVGIPDRYLELAWRVFSVEQSEKGKKQKNWRLTFQQYVKNGWLNIWAINREGEYYLTVKGKQAEIEHFGGSN